MMPTTPTNNTFDTIPVEYIILRYLVKYERLDQLIPFAFEGSRANAVNLYIDLYGLYKTLFSRRYKTATNNYISFTSSIVNLCAHYRTYFKRVRVYPKIFLVSSFNVPETSCLSIAGYNKVMKDKLANKDVHEMISLNSQLLEILCPYLPQIYFIKTEFESSVMIDHLITRESMGGNNNPNIIISSDIYPLQLAAIHNNTAFLRPTKYNGNDNSMIVCPKEHPMHRSSFWGLLSQRDESSKQLRYLNISTNNFSILSALNRFPERSLNVVFNVDKAISILSKIGENSDFSINPDTLYQLDPELANLVPPSVLDPRFRALDVGYQRNLFANSTEPHEIICEDLVDPQAISYINSKYFANDPLNVYNL